MDIKDAIQLITHPEFSTQSKKVWIDLGCGTGTFTLALASILEEESTIYAFDLNGSALKQIPFTYKKVNIEKLVIDFISTDLPIHQINGVLMANSLNYVKDKEGFLKNLKSHLTKDACFLITEYDSDASNTWVPYPINFQSLKELFSKSGYKNITKLNSRPSVYGNRQMYAALIEP
ncbi:class I SAM-dependent methyltransferase [Emticicia sp. C21]|uniref:class I SAM-dependent methyltransferase n=1 Tax=Emticicia sp. C21 TaxID=2302915 RepID=UPI000E34ED7F|nr:methyltransferase domain-containing protein [Emticicia sp. C21]RFS13622.1 methyltransferase domain-containing protein [Emticicia sp. C21]